MATKDVLVHINMNGNEIQNVLAQKLATAPSNPSAGQFYYNTNDNTLYIYNGTAWLNALAQGTTYTDGTGITISGNQISVNFTEVATAAQGALADSALQSGDDISELNNDAGYITGITGTDVTTALGYTPYNATNPSGYQANVIEGIKVNGTSQTPTNKIVSLTIPTKASDINALPDTIKYGATIDLSLNETDYKLTLSLKDQGGTTLNSKTVDFPIESVVVGGSYDNTNQKIVLTLQNGTTIDVPVGDLIAGLQTEITSTNKLDSDLVDDSTSAHKFVTNAQRTQIGTNATNIGTIQTTISGYGNIVTHNVNEFATATQGTKADTACQKFTATNPALTASGGVCTWTITNTLANADVEVVIKEVSSDSEVVAGVSTTASTITVKLNSTSNIVANTYKAVIIG